MFTFCIAHNSLGDFRWVKFCILATKEKGVENDTKHSFGKKRPMSLYVDKRFLHVE
jgi:hypothetical protein